ncbi:MAG: type II secretion system inner membrane protein GspF [Sphingopyxis sp.]|nr:type II secretion system inner membrane protein GspF [Sphingopyxis sp.]
MPDFAWRAIDAKGRETKGALTAADEAAARQALVARQLHILALTPGNAASPGLLAAWRRGKALSAKELALFTRQLATLSEVAPLEESLRTLGRQSEGENARRIIGAVHSGLVEGRPLAEAMAREAKSFPPLYRAMVAAGEQTGALAPILARLAQLLERQAEVRGKLIAALAYPLVLALVAIGVVAALMIFVVPRVVEQFSDTGAQLPFLTRAVIGLSEFLAGWWWALLLLIAALAALVTQLLRNPDIRRRFDARLLRLPLLGRLLRDLNAARFARTLATMVGSRLPLVEGLRLTVPTVRNQALAGATATLVEQVRAGGSLSAGLRDAGVFPPLLVYMTASGESAGRLEVMLERAADYLEREFDRFTAASMALLEPVIIVIMGTLVALIILAILLPILQLQSLTGL